VIGVFKFFKKTSKRAGLPPGTLVPEAAPDAATVKITVIDYDEDSYKEEEMTTVAECRLFRDKRTTTWINVDGVHNVEIRAELGECFGIHPLVMEDIANTEQRPKTEEFEDYFFAVLKMLDYEEGAVATEQVSLVLGSNYVISFQEREGDVFDAVRGRLRNAKGRIRKAGPDYLAYALLDAVVDNYFVILEEIGESVGTLEEDLLRDPTPETLRSIHELKREMIILRKSVWPLREVVSTLGRGDIPLIKESTGIFLKDVYDHTIQVIDAVETYRDVLSSMLDLYLSTVSNKMNEVMKVLTIIATIFIPLTFVAGIYGMNFRYMPELGWRWSYPVVWLVIVALSLLMLAFFKRKKWL
jgi:magnesium transporter